MRSVSALWPRAVVAAVLFVFPAVAVAQLRIEQLTSGDTTIVRTAGAEPPGATRQLEQVFSIGSFDGPPEYIFGRITGLEVDPDGSLMVFDQQVPMLRLYDSTGRFLRTIGRGGQGPGEYGPLVSFASLRGGGAIVMSFPLIRGMPGQDGQIRVHLFDSTARFVRSWPVETVPRGPASGATVAFMTSPAIVMDTAGNINIEMTIGTVADVSGAVRSRPAQAMVRFGPDGSARDTLRPPSLGLVPPPDNNSISAYSPREFRSFSRMGSYVVGRTDVYAIHVVHDRGRVTRIERDIPRIPISGAERQMRMAERPLAVIPTVKPFFSNLFTDPDGRIWVRLHAPSERIPESELSALPAARGGGARSGSANRVAFRERSMLYEVFAHNGRYLGRVQLPEHNYRPAIRGNTVWMQKLDSAGVPVVARFRIVPPLND
jgi:hypothetical protein